jgi:3D (Asp-Asp-Asp) domain-containing protein
MKDQLFLLIIFLGMTSFGMQESLVVKATSYHIKGKTATGDLTTEIEEPFLAVSRDLIEDFPLGSYVELSNCKWSGTYKVMDKMGGRHTKMVDIFSPKKATGIVKCDCVLVPKSGISSK